MKKIVLLGGGGHCRSVTDSILKSNEYEICGIVDNSPDIDVYGIKYLGNDSILGSLKSKGVDNIFICIGSVGDTSLREKLYEKVISMGYNVPSIIDKTAEIAQNVITGKGVYAGKNCVINACAKIDDMAIINTSCVVEHDCIIGKYVHISPSATLCGNVNIGKSSHIGANATVIQGIRICSDVIIGAGSVVVKDILNKGTYVGNPARKIK